MEVGRVKYAPPIDIPYGFDESDFEDDPDYFVAIWPENLDAVDFWGEYCDTQWHHSFNGRAGLRYEAIRPIVYDEFEDKEKAKEVFWAIRQIERGALVELARQAKEQAAKSART